MLRTILTVCLLFSVPTIAVGQDFTFSLDAQGGTFDPATGVGDASVPVVIADEDATLTDGFQVVLAYDTSLLSVTVVQETALTSLNAGAGPAFVGVLDLALGVSVAILYDLGVPDDFITFPATGAPVLSLDFATIPAMFMGMSDTVSVPLLFDDSIDPAGDNVVAAGGLDYAPTLISNVLTLCPSNPHMRGDTNDNGALTFLDAYVILFWFFASGPGPDCDDAWDADDSGTLTALVDPLYILQHIFVMGSPPPPAPFGACGCDPTPDSLGCTSYLSCP
ncbi:MAG: hypothetical protein AAF581_10060 [Planctomycetota bacterium]